MSTSPWQSRPSSRRSAWSTPSASDQTAIWLVGAYREPDRAQGRVLIQAIIEAIRRILKKRASRGSSRRLHLAQRPAANCPARSATQSEKPIVPLPGSWILRHPASPNERVVR